MSRPGELHPRPLSERCVNLSTHTAPVKQTPRPSLSRSRTILLYSTASSCLQLNCKYKRLTRPLCSSRITSLHRSYESVRPSARRRYSRLVVSATCASPFASENWFPQFRTRAQIRFTPPARRSPPIAVPRCPIGSSQELRTPLVLTTILRFTTSQQGFTFVRLPDPYLLGVSPQRFDSNARHHGF